MYVTLRLAPVEIFQKYVACVVFFFITMPTYPILSYPIPFLPLKALPLPAVPHVKYLVLTRLLSCRCCYRVFMLVLSVPFLSFLGYCACGIIPTRIDDDNDDDDDDNNS